jgi:hypothetical protein
MNTNIASTTKNVEAPSAGTASTEWKVFVVFVEGMCAFKGVIIKKSGSKVEAVEGEVEFCDLGGV